MRTITTKQKLVIAGIVATVSLVGSVGTYVMVVKKERSVTTLRDDVARAKQEDLVTLKRAIRSFGEHAPLIDSLLVPQAELFTYIDDVKRLAEQTGSIATVQTLAVVDVGNDTKEYPVDTITPEQRSHGVLTATIRLDGSWDQVMNFLLRIEQVPRQTSVEAVRLASVYNEKGTSQSWVALFELVTTIK